MEKTIYEELILAGIRSIKNQVEKLSNDNATYDLEIQFIKQRLNLLHTDFKKYIKNTLQ